MVFWDPSVAIIVSESGQNQNYNFSDSYVQNRTENQKHPRKIGTAIPILDRFQSDSDALVLEHQIRLISNSETIMVYLGKLEGSWQAIKKGSYVDNHEAPHALQHEKEFLVACQDLYKRGPNFIKSASTTGACV